MTLDETMETVKNYFDAWNRHDVDALNGLFDDHVCLIDWEVTRIGRNAVLNCNRDIFQTHKNIQASVTCAHVIDNIVFCELIVDTGKEKLKVIDKISIKDKKIVEISAFKQ